MNDHLIKNHRYSTIKSIVIILVFSGTFIYFFDDIDPILLIIPILFVGYDMFKREQILLELVFDQNDILFHTYSIISGKKEICINLEQITAIDFNHNLIIYYKDKYGKTSETFTITAEPWNNLFAQIKEFKLKHQDIEQLNRIK